MIVNAVKIYKCEACGVIKDIYVDKQIRFPVPFIIKCPKCGCRLMREKGSKYLEEDKTIDRRTNHFTDDPKLRKAVVVFA